MSKIPTAFLRQDTTVYSLHDAKRSDGKRFYNPDGSPMQCNQYYFGVHPDYGGGITKEDAEAVATEIQFRYNNYVAVYEALKKLNESIINSVDIVSSVDLTTELLSEVNKVINGCKPQQP